MALEGGSEIVFEGTELGLLCGSELGILGSLFLTEFLKLGLDGIVDEDEVVLELLPLEGEIGNSRGVGLDEIEGFANLQFVRVC